MAYRPASPSKKNSYLLGPKREDGGTNRGQSYHSHIGPKDFARLVVMQILSRITMRLRRESLRLVSQAVFLKFGQTRQSKM